METGKQFMTKKMGCIIVSTALSLWEDYGPKHEWWTWPCDLFGKRNLWCFQIESFRTILPRGEVLDIFHIWSLEINALKYTFNTKTMSAFFTFTPNQLITREDEQKAWLTRVGFAIWIIWLQLSGLRFCFW